MNEYRVVVEFKDAGVRRKIIPRDSLPKAIDTANGIDESINSRKLSPYWTGAKVKIESREVGKWMLHS